jgi:hypothetical protein
MGEFHKYGKIYSFYKLPYEDKNIRDNTESIRVLIDNPDAKLYIEEKIDGANFRFKIDSTGKIVFGSRTQYLGTENDQIGGRWNKCVEYIKEKMENADLKAFAGWVFYGECCVPHTIQYDWSRMPPFIGFDIRVFGGKYLEPHEAKAFFESFGLTFVPILGTVTVREALNWNEKNVPMSAYYGGQAEGVVFKSYKLQRFAKFVTDDFRKKNKKVFGKTPKHTTTDEENFIATYVTNNRIEKIIYKMLDEGYMVKGKKSHELSKKLMNGLPQLLYGDIVEEEYHGILYSNYRSLDLVQIRKKLIPKRCLQVIENMMAMNDFEAIE